MPLLVVRPDEETAILNGVKNLLRSFVAGQDDMQMGAPQDDISMWPPSNFKPSSAVRPFNLLTF